MRNSKKRKTVRDMSYGDHVGSNPNVLIKGKNNEYTKIKTNA